MQLTFASYNIHKAVGLDRRRDPERIMAVLHEIGADVVALQEADRRFGERATVLPLSLIENHSDYRAVHLKAPGRGHQGIGWHGNALLVRKSMTVIDASVVPLPTLEPRGAIRADLELDGHHLRVVGMHLDLSGIRRRQQVRAILSHVAECGADHPAVLMGDLNEWTQHGGCLREFASPGWRVLNPGRSFPSRQPLAALDRIVLSPQWKLVETRVHHSALAARGSDHLPVVARLELPEN